MNNAISPAALEEFRKGFSGALLMPADAGYDEARKVFNAMIDRKPALIAQCQTVADVVKSVRFGRQAGLEIAVRGGGHGVSGKALSEGGLVIDLRRMNAVAVDREAGTATVAGGATMSHMDRGTAPFGLATTGGRVSTTGIGGFTLGGGSGWLERKWGLACDNLLEVELVTAAGDVLKASERDNADLFWALHGGGGNFGVATSFTFRLYPMRTVTAGLLFWNPAVGSAPVQAYRDFIVTAPDDVGGGAFYITGPDQEFVPPFLRGKLTLMLLVVYAGPEAEARKLMAGLEACRPDGELIREMPYADFQCMLDDPPGYRNYWSAEYMDDMPEKAIELFCSRAADLIVPSPSMHILFPQGGAVKRGAARYPIPWRRSPWAVHPFGMWESPADDARARQFAYQVRSDFKPWANGAVYLNFIGDEGDERRMAGYGPENAERLSAIKALYDPDNVFHLNHNIRPARQAASAKAPG